MKTQTEEEREHFLYAAAAQVVLLFSDVFGAPHTRGSGFPQVELHADDIFLCVHHLFLGRRCSQSGVAGEPAAGCTTARRSLRVSEPDRNPHRL